MEKKTKDVEIKKLGHVMGIFAWVLTVFIFWLFFNTFNHLKKPQLSITTINHVKHTIIQSNQQNQYIAQGSINKQPVVFLLDTGSTDIVIPGALADTLKLKRQYSSTANTAGGSITVYQTRIKSLTIGHIRLHNVRASINPKMKGKEVLLGMSALKHINFTQKKGRLTLTLDKDGP